MVNSSVQIVKKDVEGFKNAWLVKKGEQHYILVAGENNRLGESLVFKANSKGKITDWKKVRSYINISLGEAVKKFNKEGES